MPNNQAPWPPPPDRESIRQLVREADAEGLIANHAAPADEYDTEAEQVLIVIQHLPISQLTAAKLLPILEGIWRKNFTLDEPEATLRRPALERLAQQIARFFGPEAQPQTREQRSSPASAYRSTLETYIAANARPNHKFGHQPRLYALTQQIGHGLTYDDDIVFAAVWLHDLGVFIGHRPEDEAELRTWDHVAYVTEKTPAILTDAGFPEEKIPAVLEVIRTHQPQNTPLNLEATIVRDADILEQLGAIGITRTLAKLGSDTRFHTFSDALRALRTHVSSLPDKLILAPSKALASPRIQIMQAFLAALESEAGQNLY